MKRNETIKILKELNFNILGNEDLKELNKKDIYFYVIEYNNFKYILLSFEKLFINSELSLYELIKHKYKKDEELKKFDLFIKYKNININVKDLLFNVKNKLVINYYVNFDYYFIYEFKFKKDNIINFVKENKKINVNKRIKKALNIKEIDLNLFYIIRSLFFDYNFINKKYNYNLMFIIPHFIILTNGSIGKSSLFEKLTYRIDKISDAGIYGFYDTKNGEIISGIIFNNYNNVTIDEVNEIVLSNKKIKIFENINSQLENGTYTYGKAGGFKIEFNKKFIFMGNLSADFSFNYFLNSFFSNTITIGRRFGFFIYNNDLNKIKRIKLIYKIDEKFIYNLKKFVTLIYSDFIIKFKILEKLRNNKNLKNKFEEIKKEISLKNLEDEVLINFFKSYFENLNIRFVNFVIEQTIFETLNDFINYYLKYENFDKFQKSKFYNVYYKTFDYFLSILKNNIDNIILNNIDKNNNSINDLKLNKIKKEILSFFYDYVKNKKERIIYLNYSDLDKSFKRKIRTEIYSLRKGIKRGLKFKQFLNEIGIYLKDGEDLIFIMSKDKIINIYKKYLEDLKDDELNILDEEDI